MEPRRILLRRTKALALLRDDVHEHAALVLLRNRQRRLELREVVSVDRTHVAKPELLEVGVPEEPALDAAFNLVVDAAEERQLHPMSGVLRRSLHAIVAHVRDEATQHLRKRAGGMRNAHLVVVEDHDQLPCRRREVVERLEACPVHERPVADDRDHLFVRPPRIPRRGKSRRDRD